MHNALQNGNGPANGTGKSGSVAFRPRARLMRLLGEELISDEVMAVVELVKNSYDADARTVHITLSEVTDLAAGMISVRDDGHGMTLERVLYTWMEPATTHKRGQGGVKRRTPLGRIQLGEKGVGRFAADKLGMELELVTRAPGAEEEIVVQISWHHFDHDRYLDEVENIWSLREPLEFQGHTHGTRLVVRSLRSPWDADMVTRLHNGLCRLVSPAAAATNFDLRIIVDCPGFPLISGVVVNRLIETAPYRLVGTVDPAGVLTIQGGDERHVDLRRLCASYFSPAGGDLRGPLCGPFTVSLNVWDLEPLTGRGFGVDRSLRDAIKASSGISIYRDGFRVWPYGEKDDDWLELNQRRVNNPTLRVSNNQVIGFVEITHADNQDLRDRTSREGLIDNQAFFDLKALVVAALSELETERFAIRRRLLQPRAQTPSVTSEVQDEFVLALRNALTSAGVNGQDVRAVLQKLEHMYRERLENEKDRYDQVSRLAGIGMAAELLTDSFSREVLNAMTILRTLQGEAQLAGSPALQTLVDQLSERLERVSEQLDVMGPLYRPDTLNDRATPVRSAVYDAISLFSPRLKETGTKVTLVEQGRIDVRINRAHLIQVLMILIENALQAMEDGAISDRQIAIEIIGNAAQSTLRISDSAKGIGENLQKLIFQPYYSTRQAGRGLGLHVARDILAGYNSMLDLTPSVSALPGACFEIRFDRRRTTINARTE